MLDTWEAGRLLDLRTHERYMGAVFFFKLPNVPHLPVPDSYISGTSGVESRYLIKDATFPGSSGIDRKNTQLTLPKTNSLPLKISLPKRKFIFQPSIFGCELSVSGGVSTCWNQTPSFKTTAL